VLTFRVAAEAAARDYRGSIRIQASGRDALCVPLCVKVIPLKLEKPPDKKWLMYGDDVGRLRSASDGVVLAEFRDFAEHGMDGLVEIPIDIDVSRIAEGIVNVDTTGVERIIRLAQEAGLEGPFVIWAHVAHVIARILDISPDT